MKNKQIISPIGLKGKEIHERQLSLMGIKPITESENKGNHAVELTKIGPDGNAYAIIRENHEYYIKRTDKTTGLMLEDFKYIGGLQNKKNEAYPSYAKAIKQLNLKFKSLAEAYNRGGDINVFEDDNLLEHHPYKADQALSATKGLGDNQEYVVDKAGTPLSNKAKEGKEKGQFGDNVADKKVDSEFEKVKVKEGFGMGFTGEGNLEGNRPMSEYDEKAMQNFIDQYGEEKGKQVYYATANKEDRDPETFEKNEGMTSFGDDIELTELEASIEEMMARYDESSEVDKIKSRIESVVGSTVEKIGEDPYGNPIYGVDYDINLQYYVGPNDSIIKKDKITGQEIVMANLDEELHGGQHKLDVDKDGDIEADDLRKVRAGALGEESIEEAIKRLDALLEGELKKKALK